MDYELAYHSIIGGRSSNQDRVACFERDNAVLMVVADGLGGHQGGELAAEIAVKTFQHAFSAIRQPQIQKPSAFLALTLMRAHKAMIARGRMQRPPIQPRTTAVVCLVQNGFAYWAHVGDSRLYHFRDRKVLTRTLDHTSIEQLQVDGVLSEQEMNTHPGKSRLLKCLGGPNDPTITLGKETALYRHDSLLLCSDGLWEAVETEDLVDLLDNPLDAAANDLLALAQERRGRRCDNASCAVLRWREGVTGAMPLQRHGTGEADENTLRREAARNTVQAKVRQPAASSRGPGKDDLTAIENSLKDLERLLARKPK